MKRVLEFIRSVIPADPWQLLYLVGAVFLFLSTRMKWSFQGGIPFGFVALGLLPIVFAGMFAYYGCFRPGEHPLRRIFLAVFLPVLLGMCLLIGEFAVFNEKNQSLFAHRPGLADFLHEGAVVFKGHPAGFTLAWIALAMIGVFTIRMYLGISSLPLRLGGTTGPQDESTETWYKTLMLIFVLVCPLFLLRQFTGILFSIPTWYWYRADSVGFNVYIVLTEVLNALLFVLLAILILGNSSISCVRSSLQLPEPRFAFFGLMLPVLIGFVISFSGYGLDRANWVAHGFGKALPPQLGDYFSFGDSWRWALILMIFPAFAEEIVFRGMMLRPLLQRYSLHRGIFFTGLVWAAFHFHGEMHVRYTMTQALLQLASRIAICLTMNYVLSWMTLRWNSVIPAGIAHTISNVLVVGGLNGGIRLANEIRIALWVVCGFVLFRYWPVQAGGGEEAAPTVASPEPVV